MRVQFIGNAQIDSIGIVYYVPSRVFNWAPKWSSKTNRQRIVRGLRELTWRVPLAADERVWLCAYVRKRLTNVAAVTLAPADCGFG
jgi:hypothetical protein